MTTATIGSITYTYGRTIPISGVCWVLDASSETLQVMTEMILPFFQGKKEINLPVLDNEYLDTDRKQAIGHVKIILKEYYGKNVLWYDGEILEEYGRKKPYFIPSLGYTREGPRMDRVDFFNGIYPSNYHPQPELISQYAYIEPDKDGNYW